MITLPAELDQILRDAQYEQDLCPQYNDVLRAFYLTPFDKTKVVILGQDPYQTPGKANGLAFGYHPNFTGPVKSSLKNIITNVYADTGEKLTDYSLVSWARQGVLLLNTRLSTIRRKPLAHKNLNKTWGWEPLIAEYLTKLSTERQNIVWMLWGNEAQSYAKHIMQKDKHLILTAAHPCDMSAKRGGWFDEKHFSTCNRYLKANRINIIKWGDSFASQHYL